MLQDSDQISTLCDLVVAFADQDPIVSDDFTQMSIQAVNVQSPIELYMDVSGNDIGFQTTPPLYYEETTFMPVFHQLHLFIEAIPSESL